jgi:ligand-binding sensor domain-containing protein
MKDIAKILFLLLLPLLTFAQTWTSYTELERERVYDINVDYQGYKWFATGNGLIGFDDTVLKKYGKKDGLGHYYTTTVTIDA